MPILKEHKEILATQSASKTLSEWVDFFDNDYTKDQINDFCNQFDYPIKKSDMMTTPQTDKRRYHIHQDYFKTWSRNMAYIFGLWCANGSIYGGKMFDITLRSKDKYLLRRVADELGYEGHLYDGVDRQAARLNFSCATIYNDIKNLGGVENKDLILQFPHIPQEYLPDFIRGYFDGKGNVYDIKGMRVNIAFICESKAFLITLLDALKQEAGVEGGSFDDAHHSLRFGTRDSIRLRDYMYQNDPELYLLRKWERF